MARIEEIVATLDAGEADLDESLKLYREGEPNDAPEKIASMQRPIPEILADTALWGCDLSFLCGDVMKALEVN